MVVSRTDFQDMTEQTLLTTNGAIAAFFRYRGEWHVNGICSWGNLRQAYESMVERQKRYKTGFSEKTYDRLMQLSGGSPLFYFRNGEELRQFETDEIKIPAHLIEPSRLDQEKNIVLWIPSPDEDFSLAPGAALWIHDPRNPYYNEKEARLNAFELFCNVYLTPGDMVRHLISHDMLPDLCLPEADWNDEEDFALYQRLTLENIDFLARALRRDQY